MSTIRPANLIGGLLAILILGGCAAPRERVILLPKEDGSSSGAVSIGSGKRHARLDQAWAKTDIDGERIVPGTTSADEVQKDYGAMLALRPSTPRRFIVNFRSASELTPESAAVIVQVRQALDETIGGDLVVIGHTDRVGAVDANDKLSLQRARAVRDVLTGQGIPAERISLAGRGEREPLVPTADEIAEPKNRRVEIKLR